MILPSGSIDFATTKPPLPKLKNLVRALIFKLRSFQWFKIYKSNQITWNLFAEDSDLHLETID